MTRELAVALAPDDHPDRAGMLNTLGRALQGVFERTGSMKDLDRAITAIEQAVASIPEDHPDHPHRAGRLNNLGNVLQRRFECTGSIDDLERAITMQEEAVAFTPDWQPDYAKYLNTLGNALLSKFERIGSMDDLDRSIIMREEAIASTPNNHPDRVGRLNNLAISLLIRSERTGSMDDCNCAVMMMEQAIVSTPDDHPDSAIYLDTLGNALHRRSQKAKSMEDLDMSITMKETAVESTPDDHPDRVGRLINLGNALLERSVMTESMEDLNRAITAMEQGIALTPESHPRRAGRLKSLGLALQSRFEKIGLKDDLDRAITATQQAVMIHTASPSTRIQAADSCSRLLIGHNRYKDAKDILKTAVRLLPTISLRALKRSDAQHNISQLANITSRAVSLCIADGEDPYQSLQLLELGRGILATLQFEVRSDISDLEAFCPDLAQQFQKLRDQIDPPSVTIDSPDILDSSSQDFSLSITERQTFVKQFDDLIRQIRSLPNSENFLRGPSKAELLSLADRGPIIVFNISDIRSDSFLITTDDIRLLHLPLITSDSLTTYFIRFAESILSRGLADHKRATEELNTILEWLWDVAVKPILNELGFRQMPSDSETWPRVWWVGSRLLSILPIHAAGYHDSIPSEAAIDRVISSYSTTIKSLSYARQTVARANQDVLKENAILIAMPTTPNQSSLPFVMSEIEKLTNLFSEASINTRVMQNPRKTEVLVELPKYAIAHIACHGNTLYVFSLRMGLLESQILHHCMSTLRNWRIYLHVRPQLHIMSSSWMNVYPCHRFFNYLGIHRLWVVYGISPTSIPLKLQRMYIHGC